MKCEMELLAVLPVVTPRIPQQKKCASPPLLFTKLQDVLRPELAVSRPQNVRSDLPDRSEIWVSCGQHCCRDACQIAKRYDHVNTQTRCFETSQDLTTVLTLSAALTSRPTHRTGTPTLPQRERLPVVGTWKKRLHVRNETYSYSDLSVIEITLVVVFNCPLTHCGLVAPQIWVNISSGNGLLPSDTKPLSQWVNARKTIALELRLSCTNPSIFTKVDLSSARSSDIFVRANSQELHISHQLAWKII